MATGVISEEPFMKVVAVGKSTMDRWEWQAYLKGLNEYLLETRTLDKEQEHAIQIEIAQIQLLLRAKKYITK